MSTEEAAKQTLEEEEVVSGLGTNVTPEEKEEQQDGNEEQNHEDEQEQEEDIPHRRDNVCQNITSLKI